MRPGLHNALTDVHGIEVGHWSDDVGLTGVTVILARAGAVAGVDVRGAAPGTRETDLLEPGNLVELAQAVVLTGGSAFGLDAAGGVVRYLEERGLGQRVGQGHVVPIVPAAVIYDLEVGDPGARPTARHGHLAATSASSSAPLQGSVGAGSGARAGGYKGGVGSASSELESGLVVGALMVVNSLGRTFDPSDGRLFAQELGLEGEFPSWRPAYGRTTGPKDRDYRSLIPDDSALAGGNTTIGVIATNARLDKSQVRKLAQLAHDGIARAVRPAHTMFDGDTVFALATGEMRLEGNAGLARLGAVAADTVSRAIVHAMLAATGVKGLPSYRDAFPAPSRRDG